MTRSFRILASSFGLALLATASGFARDKPPVILLKFDDLKQSGGDGIAPQWKRLTNFLRDRQIPGSIGIITETLAGARPSYTAWIKEQRAGGGIEYWFHGLDHATWTNDTGEKLSEFGGRSIDDQWSRFEHSRKLAKETLGFPFTTFGPGGGGKSHQDAATAAVMARDPDMKVWLYPSPIDDMGRKLAEAGKVTILDRVWAVNLEGKVGVPDFERFSEGYAKNPARGYFVLQGHPTHWDEPEFATFVKIIDFLIAEKAVFMTPSAYAESLGGKAAQQVPSR